MNKIKFLAAMAAMVTTAAVSAFAAPDVSLYGNLQFNAAYESGSKGSGGRVFDIQLPSDAGDGDGHYLLNVNSTKFGIDIKNKEEGKPETSGKFEADFLNTPDRNLNGNPSFRIRHAYGQVKFANMGLVLLMGQSSDLISPIVPDVANQGFLTGTGNLGTRRPQIRLTEEFSLFEITVAITDDIGAKNPKYPASQARASVKVPATWAGEKQNLTFGISGHYAHETEADTVNNADYVKSTPSYSFNIDAILPIINIIFLKGEWFMGKNLANYNKGSLGRKDIMSMGGWGQLTVKFPLSLALNSGMGVESLDKPNVVIRTFSIFTNVSYNIASNTKLILEWFRMQTDYDKDPSGATNRVEMALNYGF